MCEENIGATEIIDINFFEQLAQSKTISSEEKSGFSASYRAGTIDQEVRVIASHILQYSKDGERLLDIGCGCGDFPKLFYPKIIEKLNVTALDTETQIKNLSSVLRHARVSFQKANFMTMDDNLFNDKFDMVLLNSTIQYLIATNKISEIIDKLMSIIKDKSIIYITDVPNYDLAQKIYRDNWRGISKSNSGLIGDLQIAEIDHLLKRHSFYRIPDLESPCIEIRARMNYAWKRVL